MIEKKGARNFTTFYLLSVNSLIYRALPTNIIQLIVSAKTPREQNMNYNSCTSLLRLVNTSS